jgi:type I restriction enzyme S subunit
MYGTIGAVALTARPMAANQAIAAFLEPTCVAPTFLLQLLRREAPRLARYAGQTTQANISGAILKSYEVLVPIDIAEQMRIAHILESLDRAIMVSDALTNGRIQLQAALTQHLLNRGVLGLHVAWRNVRGIGEIPANWEVHRLADVAHVQSGRAMGRANGNVGTKEIPYLTVANVKDGYVDLSNVKSMRVTAAEAERFALRPGDVLFTEGGDADKLGRGTVWQGQIQPCVHQNHIFAVRPDPAILRPEFLATYAKSVAGKRYFLSCSKQTTNLASVNSSQLKAMLVPMPSVDEQDQIVALVRAVEDAIRADSSLRNQLHLTRELVAEGLLTGRIRSQPLGATQ